MSFDIPRNRIFEVAEVDVRLDPTPHPFLVGKDEVVAERWRAEQAANPALFDGEVVLLSELAYADRRLVGRCHVVRYSQYLYWRTQRPVDTAEHAYAHAVLVASDGALVAIRMAAHTMNAGKVYFAAGSVEPVDFRDGRVDLDFNMQREVLEETGIDLWACRAEPSLHALSRPAGTVIFRRYIADRPADELAASIAEHVRAGHDDEIVGPVIIRSGAALPEGIAAHMPALVDWHFSRWPLSAA